MAEFEYTFTVPSTTISTTTSTINNGSTVNWNYDAHNNCSCGNCSGWHYWWYPYNTWTIPTTKYLYQIFCPKPGCKGKFWAELDEIKPCPVCKSRIKVTDKESDYEVAVTK
jgi:hypothetical protein